MPKSRSVSVLRYVSVAIAFVLLRFCLLAVIIGFIWTAKTKDINIAFAILGVALFSVILGLYFLVNLKKVICPLCRTPVFQALGGIHKKKAKQRFGFALKLIRGQRRPKCIYCKEPFRWKA